MHAMQLFELMIGMLFATIALHYLAERLKLPPAVALLAGGAFLAFLPGLPTITLDPALVLVIFLPPLLIDGAWFIALGPLRRHMIGITALAVGAVLFTTAVVAVVTHALMPSMPWAACAALGAIVSPPDAISARAVLQRLKLPRRLSILLEGESLLNDATGLVLFRFAVAAGVTGAFSAVEALQSFLLLAIGGAAVGSLVGAIWVVLVRRLGDDYLIIAASVLSCWAAYLFAETAHVSGVIATVVTGLICGWYQHVLFPASVRMRGTSFWTVMVFFMEALVFMLIGLSLRGVIRWAGLTESEAERARLTMSQAEAAMAQAQASLIEKRAYDADGKLIHPRLLERYQRKATGLADYAGREADYRPGLHAHFDVVLEAVAVARAELIRLHRAGEIDEETLQELERDLDLEELSALSAKA